MVDSDDIIHPERFERLLAAAEQHHADIVADNLLLFHDDGSPAALMLEEESRGSFAVSPRDWVLAGMDGVPALGYLKPLIRADRLADLRYDESLRIGEDYDLVLRLLMAGAQMTVVREPFYLYRRHSASISHRLSVPDMQAMLGRQEALATVQQPLSAELAAAFARRSAVLRAGLSYAQLVASLKSRQLGQVLGRLAAEPGHFGRLWQSLAEGRRRRRGQEKPKRRTDMLALGAAGMHGVDRVVPDYVPAQEMNWSVPRPHWIWRELAGHAGGRCVALDRAGQYAAGFIPEVMLENRAVPQEAL